MAFKSPSPPSSFPIFAPKSPFPRRPSEIRFSRWNNANAQKFVRRERHQKEIEDEIRRERRFHSATIIAENREPGAAEDTQVPEFKSVGTPSSPSRSSIPGKASKYSKAPPENPNFSHPAFRPAKKASRKAVEDNDLGPAVWVGDNGLSYRVPDAPFEFQYSYTETPKVKPLALREPPVVPFGPATMPRPWTGRKPLPPSKKKLPEFDSFRLPPPHKKGVKPVQSPGPFVSGSGPKYVKSREEILGEALTDEEIKDLVQGCLKIRRQLNMGRDGLTHNMLDNIHAHWKRRRVCKIKCKGVCTVDMDNVRQQLEEKTGGKIIYGKGGVLFLFRGRNYNYRTRPKFPLMLWKPATPVYPRLVKQVPEGLTLEEASEMRKRSQKLPPICKLGKNGVYADLVNNVKEAFEECDLVRINCQGLNVSDYKKIGGKLKDLVPCVLISFEHEHILMWRGRDWKSSLPMALDETKAADPDTDSSSASLLNSCNSLILDCPETSNSGRSMSSDLDKVLQTCNGNTSNEVVGHKENEGLHSENNSRVIEDPLVAPSEMNTNWSPTVDNMNRTNELMVTPGQPVEETCTRSSQNCTEGVLLLLRQAIEGGSALILDDDEILDATIIYEKAVALAKTAPPGPVFRYRIKKALVQKIKTQEGKRQENSNLEIEEFVALLGNNSRGKKSYRTQRKQSPKIVFPDIVPHGSLGVDELAKLLA